VKRIGLTGGIGCGKSTVLRMFRDLGLEVVDTDQLARDVVAPGTAGLRRVIRAFGRDVLRADGSLDRDALGKRVFTDLAARERLERITHPAIGRAMAWRFAMLWIRRVPAVIVEVPLLFEKKMESRFDETVAVVADAAAMFRRLRERNGWTDDVIRARIESQLPVAEKASRATHVIDNSGDLESTRRRVAELASRWR